MPGTPHSEETVKQALKLSLVDGFSSRRVEEQIGVSFNRVAAWTRDARKLLKPDLEVRDQLDHIARQIAGNGNWPDEADSCRDWLESEEPSGRPPRNWPDRLDQEEKRLLEEKAKAEADLKKGEERKASLLNARAELLLRPPSVQRTDSLNRNDEQLRNVARQIEDCHLVLGRSDDHLNEIAQRRQRFEERELQAFMRRLAEERLKRAEQIDVALDAFISSVQPYLAVARRMYAEAGDEFRGGGHRALNMFGRRQLNYYLAFRLSQLMPGGDWPRLDPALRPIYGRPFVEIERDILRQWLDGEGEEGEDETGETDFATAEADEVDPIEGNE